MRTGWPWTEGAPSTPATMPDGAPWPRMSMTTPSFNQAKYLEETIRSVLLQGYPNLEYFIFDGGSTDGSLDIIRKYESWVTYCESGRDRGQGDAINKGFARSTGDYVAWINSDDVLYPGFITRMVTAFQKRPDCGLLYGDVDTAWDMETKRTPRLGRSTTVEEMLRTLKIPIPQQSCMWRRSVVEKIGPLEPGWRVTLDREYLMRTCLCTKFGYIPGSVALFRYHSGTIAMSEQRGWLTEIPKLYREMFEKEYFPEKLRALRRETMSSAFMFCARTAVKCGEQWKSIVFTIKAIGIYPWLLFGKNDVYTAIRKRFRKLLS